MTVSLSNGVRSALSSLQSTAAAAQSTQLRLATGKRVNNAIDNPLNFFTASSLNSRAGNLSSLLDGMSTAIKTIEAADKGIKGVTKVVESAQATIRQAQNDSAQNRPVINGTSLATAAEAAAANKSRKEVALDKLLFDDNGGTANDATATYSGNLGVTSAAAGALTVKSGNTTYSQSGLFVSNGTLRDLVTEINKSGLAAASVTDDGRLVITGTGSDTLRVGFGTGASEAAAIQSSLSGTLNTNVGLAATDATTGVSSTGNSTVRTNLIQQFNDLRTQIDQLAQDARFNGVNLLRGDSLSVVFNEKTGSARSKLDIQGSTVSSANLGILTAFDGAAKSTGMFNIQNDNDLNTTMATLTGALTSLKSMASSLGSNLAAVQIRNDFTKDMIDTLRSGADNLILADSNEEGARLLALNTRAQLSQTALSLASKADQAILRLF